MRNVGWDEHGGRLPLPEEEGGIGRYALPKTGKFGERKRLYDDEPHTFPFYDQMKDEYEAAGHLGPEWNEDHTRIINPHPVGENPRLTARRYFRMRKDADRPTGTKRLERRERLVDDDYEAPERNASPDKAWNGQVRPFTETPITREEFDGPSGDYYERAFTRDGKEVSSSSGYLTPITREEFDGTPRMGMMTETPITKEEFDGGRRTDYRTSADLVPITKEEFDGEDPRDTARRYYERRFGNGPKTSREAPYMFGRGDKNSRQRLFGWADDKE